VFGEYEYRVTVQTGADCISPLGPEHTFIQTNPSEKNKSRPREPASRNPRVLTVTPATPDQSGSGALSVKTADDAAGSQSGAPIRNGELRTVVAPIAGGSSSSGWSKAKQINQSGRRFRPVFLESGPPFSPETPRA